MEKSKFIVDIIYILIVWGCAFYILISNKNEKIDEIKLKGVKK